MCFKLNELQVKKIIETEKLNSGIVNDIILLETNTWKFCIEFDSEKK